MRIRSRQQTGRYREGSATTWSNVWHYNTATTEYISEDPVPGGNKVFHSKAPPLNGVIVPRYCCPPTAGYYRSEWENFPVGAPTSIPGFVSRHIPVNPLNRSKLPTSSEFGIIQFFAELDDTLAMFSKKFLKELSYGSITWGVMPFVNDVKNIIEMIRNFNADLSSVPYEDTLKGEFEVQVPCGTIGHAVSGSYTLRYSGAVNYSFADDILLLYDRIGFHPDLETVWDLVPLSFVVDWFIPVGDIIDRIHDRGWITSALFTGWKSQKIEYSAGWPDTVPYGIKPFVPFEIYTRDYLNSSLITAYECSKPIELKRPSFKQLFNTAYIAKLGKIESGIKRKIFHR